MAIVDNHNDIAKRLQDIIKPKLLNSTKDHVFGTDGKCIYCPTHAGSPAAQHAYCANAPGARTRNNHNFESPYGRCSKCLAGQNSFMADKPCPA
jgi:hypothetical protein